MRRDVVVSSPDLPEHLEHRSARQDGAIDDERRFAGRLTAVGLARRAWHTDAVIVALAGRRTDPLGAAQARFPVENLATVAMRVQRMLVRLRPLALVSSAACGADLVGLDVARKLRIRRRIVLPFGTTLFRDSSVTDRPGDWSDRFDVHIMETSGSHDLVVLGLGQGDYAYRVATQRILDEATALGGTAGNVTAIVLWEGTSRGAGDITLDFAARARSRRIPVLSINTLTSI